MEPVAVEVEEAPVGPVAGGHEEDEEEEGAVDAGPVEEVGADEEEEDEGWRGVGWDEEEGEPTVCVCGELISILCCHFLAWMVSWLEAVAYLRKQNMVAVGSGQGRENLSMVCVYECYSSNMVDSPPNGRSRKHVVGRQARG